MHGARMKHRILYWQRSGSVGRAVGRSGFGLCSHSSADFAENLLRLWCDGTPSFQLIGFGCGSIVCGSEGVRFGPKNTGICASNLG